MNFKRTTLSWGLIFLMVFSFSTASFSTANADQIERYMVTGDTSYDLKNTINPDYMTYSSRIQDGLIVKYNNTITFTYSHETLQTDDSDPADIRNFELIYKKDSNSTWYLSQVNGYLFTHYSMDSCSSFDDLTRLTSIHTNFYGPNNHNTPYAYIMFYNLTITPISNVEGIASGTYIGTGSASVQTVFGNFNLGTLAKTKIKATVTSSNLQLAFQAKNIPYNVTAHLISIDDNGVSTYEYQDDGEIWNITVTPDGKLDGTLTYLGDRGIMNFSIQLQSN